MTSPANVATIHTSTRRRQQPVANHAPSESLATFDLRPSRALLLPLLFTAAVAAFTATRLTSGSQSLRWSFYGAAAVLTVWDVVLIGLANAKQRRLAIEIVLRRPHYLQACVQFSLMLYWGWYWRPVYAFLPFILAQLMFAYALDMLLNWSRRDTYLLGFGPFPVVLSINFFLWFRSEWFFLQFAMVALGLAAKEFIRWNRDGRRVHIFNPSSFPLAVFSVVLLATGTTAITSGVEIATTLFYPPHIYAVMFLLGLVGQFFFGVTTMTMSAVVSMYLFGLLYQGVFGVPFFLDTYIPIAVFLGMHFLFTDPATAPKTELGRIIFGILYAAGVTVSYAFLERYGAPSFYDKLLPIPVLNVMVQAIDRFARSKSLAWTNPAGLARGLVGRPRNVAYIGVWAVAFLGMSATKAVGDAVPGHWLPFWEQACADRRHNACPTLALFLDEYCHTGSGWACNEMGVLFNGGGRGNPDFARQMFGHACANGFQLGCENDRRQGPGFSGARRGDPELSDYEIVLREGKGPLPGMPASAIYERACQQGWKQACLENSAASR